MDSQAAQAATGSIPDACPLTGSKNITLITETKDFGCTGEPFSIWENRDTGLRFTWPRPDPESMRRYYAMDQYLSHDKDTGGFMSYIYRKARTFAAGRKMKLAEAASISSGRNLNLLDFGGGSGYFAAYCRNERKAWSIAVVEPDPQAAALAGRTDGVRVVPDMNGLGDERDFDVITAWHALEHVHRPDEILRHFARSLKEGGAVLVALPNYRSFDSWLYGSHWAALDTPRHLFHFSPASFEALAESCGFRIEKRKRMMMDAFYVSLLSERYAAMPGGVFRAAGAGLWSSFNAMLNVNNCSSVIYVLRRKDGI